MNNTKHKTASLFDSKVGSFRRSEHEHQGGAYPPDVLAVISRLEIQAVLDAVDVRRDARVLDIGAGGGRWTLALADRVASVTAVEPSALFDILQSRTQRLPNVTCIRQPFEDVELTQPFDLVIIYGTLMYVADDDQAREFLAKAARLVKPGGHLVLGEAVARVYKCMADWRETPKHLFLSSVLGHSRYWEVLRPAAFYRRTCRAQALRLHAEFESHAPVFGKSRAWPAIRSIPWPVLCAYNRACRNTYGRLKWALDMRRMRMTIWSREHSA